MRGVKKHVNIRYLEKDDIESILELLKKTNIFFEPCDTKETYEQMTEYNPQSVLVMTYDKSIIGMVIVVYSPLVSVLYHGCIDPEFRRRELGSILMLEVEKVINDLGGTKAISGYVEEGNVASLSLFKKLGFKTYPTPIVYVYKDSEFDQ